MSRKIAIIILSLILVSFGTQHKLSKAAAPAVAAGGAGGYVIGALAVGGLVGVFGYTEHADIINQHAMDVWNGTTDLIKDGWNSTVDWVSSLPFVAINNPDVTQLEYPTLEFDMNKTMPLVQQTVANAIPDINQRIFEADATKTMIGNLPTAYPNVFKESYDYGDYSWNLTFTDKNFFVVTVPGHLPILAKSLRLDVGSKYAPDSDDLVVKIGGFSLKGHVPTTSQWYQIGRTTAVTVGEYKSLKYYDAINTVEQAIGLIFRGDSLVVSGDGAINDIYIGDEALIDQIHAANTYAMQQAYRDSLPNVGTNTGRITTPFPEGKLGVPVADLPAGSDVVYNPGDSTWYTPDGTYVGNPTNVIPKPLSIPKVIAHPLTGFPTLVFETPWGYVDIGTGQLITTGNPAIPGTPSPPNIDLSRPTRKLDFTPLLMTGESFTTKFPFSIPWDLKNQFSVFNVTNETPVFEIDKQNFIVIGNKNIPFKMDISLEQFESIAAATRWFFLIGFDVGIILLMRRLMPE